MLKRTIALVLCGFVPLFAAFPLDTIRVTCVGNSITEGSNASHPSTDNYPAQLGAMLGKGWLVKNCGKSGTTMLKNGDVPYWKDQKYKDAVASNPTIVTISLGTNDSKPYNWDDHKAEFVPDYSAMIDTFRALPSHPEVWLCLPVPAFRVNFDIRDSVIVSDIIPMIRQLAADKGCPLVDFNTPFLPLSNLVPDGIHPNTEGYSVMAKILYTALTGKAITQIQDENLAEGKPVEATNTQESLLFDPAHLTDGDPSTFWKATGFPSQAVVDLGSVQIVDAFAAHFGTEADAGYQYTIETSSDSTQWNTAVDRSARTDTATVPFDKTAPLSARYVRLTITDASHPKGTDAAAAELFVLKANEQDVHAPILFSQSGSVAKTYQNFNVYINWPAGQEGSCSIFYKDRQYGAFFGYYGYQDGSKVSTVKAVVRKDSVNAYYAVAFYDGVEVTSDTITLDTRTTGVEPSGQSAIPSGIRLSPAYPNPFNPSTTVSFTLDKPETISLKVFDTVGRHVADLAQGPFRTGTHQVVWNATDDSGQPMASGIYLVRLEAGNHRFNQKMVLAR